MLVQQHKMLCFQEKNPSTINTMTNPPVPYKMEDGQQ